MYCNEYLNREVPITQENSRKLRIETLMSLIYHGHVLAKVSHVVIITLRDMSVLRVMLASVSVWSCMRVWSYVRVCEHVRMRECTHECMCARVCP